MEKIEDKFKHTIKSTMISMYKKEPLICICQKCGAQCHHEKNNKGYYLQLKLSYCNKCIDIIAKEEEAKKIKERETKKLLIQKQAHKIAITRGMPEVFFNVTQKDFDVKKTQIIIAILQDLCKSQPWLNKSYIFYGDTGVGKSHITAFIYISWIFNNWYRDFSNPKTCNWISLSDLSSKVKASMNKENDGEQIININALIPDFLVMEFGDIEKEGVLYGSKQSPFLSNLFQSIVDYRWKLRYKRTVWITRLGKKQELYNQLCKHYDPASIGRLLEQSQPIRMSGKDKRKEAYLTKSLWDL